MHGLPFATPRALKKLVRTALARRISALSRPGDKPPRIAFVGAGGAGKTTAIAHVAAAYAAAHVDVIVIALRTSDGGATLASRLEPLGIPVIAAADATEAKRRLGRRDAGIVFIDTPPIGLGDRQTAVSVSAELRALEADEVHLALPATLSAGAADEQYAALAPLARHPRRAHARRRDDPPRRADRARDHGPPAAVLRLHPRRRGARGSRRPCPAPAALIDCVRHHVHPAARAR